MDQGLRRSLLAWSLGLLTVVAAASAQPNASATKWPAPECETGPCVHFVFAGACNFQVTKGADGSPTALRVIIPDTLNRKLDVHDVLDHRAMIQFNRKQLMQADPQMPTCPAMADCALVDVGRRKITFSLPNILLQDGKRFGADKDDSFNEYVLPIGQGLKLSAKQPFAEASVDVGRLWATGSEYKCSFPKNARTYHREVIVSVPLDPGKGQFSIQVGTDSLDFKYDRTSQKVIRFLSVPSGEACLLAAHSHWSTDHDFALNYLLADKAPASPWVVPQAAGLSGIKYPLVTFCDAAAQVEQLFQKLVEPAFRKQSSAAKVNSMATSIIGFMSSMGSDCIGARWE